MVAAGLRHSVGLRTDGTVVAVGDNSNGQCNVSTWSDITQIAVVMNLTVGLRSDSTIIVQGGCLYGNCSLDTIKNITQVAVSANQIAFLKSDSTVMAIGNCNGSECDLSSWTQISSIAGGELCILGIKSDGTIQANKSVDLSSWSGITQGACGNVHVVAVTTTGTVFGECLNPYFLSPCDVSSWTDIKQVAAGRKHTVGLKIDGSVLAIGDSSNSRCNVSSWSDIIQIAAGSEFTLGLRADGSVLATGYNAYGQCNVTTWNLKPPPKVPNMISPENNSQQIVVPTQFLWQHSDDAISYDLQISNRSDFSTLILDSSGILDTTLSITLPYYTQFYWRIRTQNANGSSAWTTRRTFRTAYDPSLPPLAPTLVSPSANATEIGLMPTLKWFKPETANSFSLQIASDSLFSQIIESADSINDTIFTIDSLHFITTYYWHIKALNSNGASLWSAVRAFSTKGYDTFLTKITPGNGSDDDDNFGTSVALSDSIAAIGSSLFNLPTGPGIYSYDNGAAYIYNILENGCSIDTFFAPLNEGGRFGIRIALAGNRLVSGTPNYSHIESNTPVPFICTQVGATNVYDKSNGKWAAIQVERLTLAEVLHESDKNSHMGLSVCTENNFVVSGALDYDVGTASNAGAVFIHNMNFTQWYPQYKIVATDFNANAYFGSSVALHDSLLLIGSFGDNDHGANSGSAYIFKRNAAGWQQTVKLLAPDGVTGDRFGTSVAISDSFAFVGSYLSNNCKGAVYIFKKQGSIWPFLTKIQPTELVDTCGFGCSIALNNRFLLIGAPYQSNTGHFSGTSYLYKYSNSQWVKQCKINSSDGSANDYFGTSVAFKNNKILIGAPGAVVNGVKSGAAYLYNYFDLTPEKPVAPVLVKPINDEFGIPSSATFSWRKTERTTFYTLQIATDNSFSNLIFNETLISDTSVTVEDLELNTTYYWRARSSNDCDSSEWSDVFKFSTSKKTLSIIGIIAEDKFYDGTITATLSGGTLTGVADGDDVTLNIGSGVFEDKTVGTDKTVTVSGYSLSGTDTSKYSLILPTGLQAKIIPKEVVFSDVTVADKVYDGNAAATISYASLDGFVNGDDIALNNGSGVFSDKNAGTNKVVTPRYSLSGTDASNYFLTQPTGLRADITPKPVTLTGLSASDKVYDGNTTASLSNGALNGVVDGDNVTLNSGTGVFENKKVGTGKSVSISGYSLNGTDASNYSLTKPSGLTADISTKQISLIGINIADKVYDGNVTATLSGGTLSGIVTGDDVTLNSGSGVFANKNVGTDKSVTLSGYSINGTDASNYSLVQPSGLTADITSKPISLTGVGASDKVYDGNVTATLTDGTLSGIVTGDDVSPNNGSGVFADKNVGTGKSITVSGYSISGTDASNYSLTQPSNITADITAAPLTIEAEDAEKGQDQEDPVFTVKYSGFISGDDSSVVTGLTIEREPGESPGTYAITPSNASASNYEIKYENGKLTIRASTSVLRRNNTSSEKTNGPVKGVFIGPNPVSIQTGKATIRIITDIRADIKMFIYDAVGNLIFDTMKLSPAGKLDISWDLHNKRGHRVGYGTYLIVAKVQYHNGFQEILKAKLGIKP